MDVIKNSLERQFKLSELKTSISTEIIAGITTFTTMAYVLAVVPKMMGETGLPTGEILTAMVLMIGITTIAMALFTNRPFVLAPGMGSVAIFSITLVQLQHVSVGVASALVFLSGILFLLVTVLGIRDQKNDDFSKQGCSTKLGGKDVRKFSICPQSRKRHNNIIFHPQ